MEKKSNVTSTDILFCLINSPNHPKAKFIGYETDHIKKAGTKTILQHFSKSIIKIDGDYFSFNQVIFQLSLNIINSKT